ncbi:acyl-CoA/acyl-ACP dehydrogenase [Evansella sp. AB-P1]|uniref:acyl-CoA dehydrogenase family protein n=1 Tax=Evansella sp. AB-P1 TaxID=3037653 RepID=UPI00241CA46E|nr:acyl-CoA dehydrogenase family protein [Evansella sp. AB-P1]MDG5788556.1 acyl-CoA/acyl-ACP dehydrogenase [Evansella sp. AB-P1]
MTVTIQEHLANLFQKELKSHVRDIDCGDVYLKDIFKILGHEGHFQSQDISIDTVVQREIEVVKQASTFCMTTGFIIWCHLAALTYIRNSVNEKLKSKVLQGMENGEIIAGTGLSNPMKYYAGLEKLHLKAKPVDGGYIVSGTLPSVSNLGDGHWFGAIAEVNENKRVMVFVPCDDPKLSLKIKVDYMGINGSGTFACRFQDVFIPDDQVVAEDADSFVKNIRPYFVVYQIPLGFGVTDSAIQSIKKNKDPQQCNQFLPIQQEELEQELILLESNLEELFNKPFNGLNWNELLTIRRDIATLTTKATHAAMLHNGGSAYLQTSPDGRRLREAYFLINLTPTLKHLGKMIHHL